MTKIAIIGPESTGKTTLAKELARECDGVYISEVSRAYLRDKGNDCKVEDIYEIARLQKQAETRTIQDNHNAMLYFSDTEAICIYVWLDFYHYDIPAWLTTMIEQDDYDLYLLCDIDLPWVADDLRKNPEDRQELFERFTQLLDLYQKPFKIISGVESERTQNAKEALSMILP